MEVDHKSFFPKLLPILQDIADASFVTFDLEMSGISIRQNGGSSDRSKDSGKLTMQQQYEETREAADKYQILQLGITCVHDDHELGMYVARPYNFNVSPLFIEDDKLGINRDFTLSSSAIHFLIKNSFDIGAVFDSGVPYLSREEDAKARSSYAERAGRSSNIGDIVLDPGDQDAMAFYRKARETMVSWTSSEKKELDFVNISVYGGLNAFQRRLVHQLVRNEFPGYRVFARDQGNFMQVEKEDSAKEAKISATKLKGFELGLAKQTGLRYIVEALAGGHHLEEIEPVWFCKTEAGASQFIDVRAVQREISNIQNILRRKQLVIVGHNLFTDLIFIYRTFIATLPDTVIEFQDRIHELFPYIIDTKYLATHEGGSMKANSRLKELCNGLNDQPKPVVILDEKHLNYFGKSSKAHEAGYDSWMTAQVLIKLSAKLKAEQNYAKGREANDMNKSYLAADKELRDSNDDVRSSILNPLDTNMSLRMPPQIPPRGQSRFPKKSPTKSPRKYPVRSRFSTKNSFNQLDVEGFDSDSDSEGGIPISHVKPSSHKRESSLMDTDFDDHFRHSSHSSVTLQPEVRDTNSLSHHQRHAGPEYHAGMLNPGSKEGEADRIQEWIPDFDDPFWSVYVNKLRVNGTASGICQLGV